jgi:amidase
MISFEEYRKLDGCAIAQAIQLGELDPLEVLEAAIDRANQINDTINAINYPMYDQARKYMRSKTRSGALYGVPMLLKDLLGELNGVPTSNGSAAYVGKNSVATSTLVRRFSDLGLIIIGKSNTPEFGLLATTEPVAFGATRNPWNIMKTAGGSSGGSAAAVAAGIVPIASAGDGGGSIRIPASCCGLFGFKPTRGLNPMGPFAESWDGAVSEHVITRSVRDSLAVLKGTIGSDYASHVPQCLPEDFLSQADIPINKPLKIAFSYRSFFKGPVQKECVDAVRHTARILEKLGHDVVEAEPDIDGEALLQSYVDIYIANVCADISDLVDQYGVVFVRRHVETLSYFLYQLGLSYSAGAYIRSRRRWPQFHAQMDQFHQRFDFWLTPVLSVPPFDLGVMQNKMFEERLMGFVNRFGITRKLSPSIFYNFSRPHLQKAPFTQLANITGQPAMSMPLFWSSDGLPVGVQFIGRRLSEEKMFRLALQIEQASPWFDKVPTVG